ncbi:uncharacterized protein CXorf38-like [Hypanus sabinus]|uniref:uncharacterized protein CXorf38-like n=1 Tax=Hypanus sabinus TaxID=79690 RepID=UPI0028C38D81|nr:uncharacterized protein CXorf38-like [Hypanus sabinus]XP_059824240.1 uncharacterized protein CXorf38-like [Hypanus sabinus]XP_059824241.1 uncharacterized protein CXorf38-like [Hypanus sabinus]
MQSELSIRFNDGGYKNWIKAGLCLQKIRDCILGFVITEIEKFHQVLLGTNPNLRQGICKNSCKSHGTKFQTACFVCREWKKEILRHHTDQNSTIYWGNCCPLLWPTNAWEVAKVYMPRGQANRRGPENCDAAALLNLFIFCDHFHFERRKVIEVIKCRNDLMHSIEMSVSAEWFENYKRKILILLKEFESIPEATAANKMIHEVTSSDWKVKMTVTDAVDATVRFTDEEIGVGEICNIELNLIKEWAEELNFALEEQEPLQQHLNSLNRFKEFLKQNKELESELHKELQQLFILEKRLNNGKDL